MAEEWKSLAHLLKELVNEIDYDEEGLLTNCGVVSCWIVITAIHDKEDNDSFFQYLLQKHREPNETPDPDGERVLIKIYTSVFEKLDASFKQWRKNPNPTTSRHFAKTILDAIIKGDSGKGKETYYDLEYTIVIEFFADQFKCLVEKQQSLMEKIKGEKNKPVQKNITTEKPTEQPKAVRSALDILDEAKCKLDSPAFEKVQECVKLAIQENISDVVRIIREEQPPRNYVYSMIANVSGDWLESGEYHMYRGVLNPMGIGEDLLKLFDAAVDELVLIGACDKKFAKEQKKGVRANIKPLDSILYNKSWVSSLLHLTGSSKLYKKETYLLKDNKLLWLVPIALLLIALLSLPYYYYQLMRWAICGCAAYIAYQNYKEKGCGFLTVAFIVIAVLYNPIEPIHLFREAWAVINIITVLVFLYGLRQKYFVREVKE